MMTADQILAAHASRPARTFSDGGVWPQPSNAPWWKVSDSLGGDLRAFKDKGKEAADAAIDGQS